MREYARICKNKEFNYVPNIYYLHIVDVSLLTSLNDDAVRVNNYCQTCNTVKQNFCNSYYDRNHTKY